MGQLLNTAKFFRIIVMRLVLFCVLVAVLAAAVFLFLPPGEVAVVGNGGIPGAANATSTTASSTLLSVPEAPTSSQTILGYASSAVNSAPLSFSDIGNQQPLPSPPRIAKGVYLTGWSAGYAPKLNYLMNLAKRTEVNAVVIDIKDYSGYVSYRTAVPMTKEDGAEGSIKIAQPNALLKKLHDAGIYVIGRITVFQDPVLAKAHPEWALINKTTGKTWLDNKGLAWMDAAAKPVWEYNTAIAKDAIARGFDEVQFDYIRFASDGDLSNIGYPYWQKTRTGADLTRTSAETEREVIRNFFKYLRENLTGAKISVDLFGLSTINADDLGIGQVIEDAYKYFDYVSPMVYPSHYASGFLGYANPAKYPYEVIKYSLERALVRVAKGYEQTAVDSTSTVHAQYAAKLRPWLQDFDLGATYDAAMVKKEIQAVYDAFSATQSASSTASTSAATPPTTYYLLPTNPYYGGWLLWDPANIYTEGALEKN